MAIDNDAVGDAFERDPLKQEAQMSYLVRDEITGEIVADPDGFPIAELESDDYFELADTLTIEERSMGERAWRFGHVIVDEAQDLTPMQWRMISRRARGLSMTIVGDVAQRTTGEPGSWETLLPEAFGEVNRFDLSTNYRSPEEIEPYANAILQQLDPDLRPPVSIRQSGNPVVIREIQEPEDRSSVVGDLALELVEKVDGGRVAVLTMHPWTIDHPQVRCLTPGAAKGMEFDAVIVDEPAEILEASHGLGLLYVALTRTTNRLTIMHEQPLPESLREL